MDNDTKNNSQRRRRRGFEQDTKPRSRSQSPSRGNPARPIRDREDQQPQKPSDNNAPAEPAKPAMNAAAIAAAAAAKVNAQLASMKQQQQQQQQPNTNTNGTHSASFTSSPGAISDKPKFELSSESTSKSSEPVTSYVDINDVRNKYLLTKEETQEQIKQETGATVQPKGKYYPDRTKATDKVPPLHLYVEAPDQAGLDKALAKIDELINRDLGSLVDERRFRREEFKSMTVEDRILVGELLATANGRQNSPKLITNMLIGPGGTNVKHIQNQTGCRVLVKGVGSGYIDRVTGHEDEFPLCIVIIGQSEDQVREAKDMANDLLTVVSEDLSSNGKPDAKRDHGSQSPHQTPSEQEQQPQSQSQSQSQSQPQPEPQDPHEGFPGGPKIPPPPTMARSVPPPPPAKPTPPPPPPPAKPTPPPPPPPGARPPPPPPPPKSSKPPPPPPSK